MAKDEHGESTAERRLAKRSVPTSNLHLFVESAPYPLLYIQTQIEYVYVYIHTFKRRQQMTGNLNDRL